MKITTLLLSPFVFHFQKKKKNQNSQNVYNRMLAQLAQCEFTVLKSHYTSTMTKSELNNYEDISKTIDSGIEQAKTQIEQSKENLVLAKKIRKNRMEYDVLAKIINQQPDRKKTTEKLQILKQELSQLEDNRRQLERKLSIRRNEFTVLMRSIKELQTKLDDNGDRIQSDDDDDNGEDDAMSCDDEMPASPKGLSLSPKSPTPK